MQTYLSIPLLDFAIHFDGVEHGQLDDITLKAAGIGTVTPWKPTTNVRRTAKLPLQFHTADEWRAFRDFMAARGGIIQSFWLPVWLTDYPLQNIGASSVDILPIGFANYFAPGNQFSYAALIRPIRHGAVIEPHKIDSVTVTSVETLNFDEAVGPGFSATTSILCGLMMARFTNSQVDYHFVSDGVVECEIDFDECPKEYP